MRAATTAEGHENVWYFCWDKKRDHINEVPIRWDSTVVLSLS